MPRASLWQAVKSLFRGDTYPADGPPPHRAAVVAFSMQVSGPQAPCGYDTQGFSPSSALLGLFGIAAALNGYLYKKIPVLFRLALVAGGLCMMIPGTASDVAGFIVVGGIMLVQRMSARKLAA